MERRTKFGQQYKAQQAAWYRQPKRDTAAQHRRTMTKWQGRP
jgi:hypothetical protein